MLLPGNGIDGLLVFFVIDQDLASVFLGESVNQPTFMLSITAVQVVGDADVEYVPVGIGHDIGPIAHGIREILRYAQDDSENRFMLH